MGIKELLEEFALLNLPKDEYVLVGSAPLAIREIRDAQDLDILVSDKLWAELAQKRPINTDFGFNKITLAPDIDALGDGSLFKDPQIASFEEMLTTADIISGYPFLNLELLKKFKVKLGREKDYRDIELINQYLAEHSSP